MERMEAAALHGILVQPTVQRATGNPRMTNIPYRPPNARRTSLHKEVGAEEPAPALRFVLEQIIVLDLHVDFSDCLDHDFADVRSRLPLDVVTDGLSVDA